MAIIMNGRDIANHYKAEYINEIKSLSIKPCLAVVLVGNNQASVTYVRGKERVGNEIGVEVIVKRYDEDITQAQLIYEIEVLNSDTQTSGIIVQLPLPNHINSEAVINKVCPSKDVDGFTYENSGKLMHRQPRFVPCTPLGIMKMLEFHQIDLTGLNCVVLGRSNIVGTPMASLLTAANATVTLCHSHTKEIEKIAAQADLLVVAIGKANMITAKWIKPGAIVIDVGINRNQDNKLCGDVDFEDCLPHVGYISPVPQGVGPMTISMLMHNTIKAAKENNYGIPIK